MDALRYSMIKNLIDQESFTFTDLHKSYHFDESLTEISVERLRDIFFTLAAEKIFFKIDNAPGGDEGKYSLTYKGRNAFQLETKKREDLERKEALQITQTQSVIDTNKSVIDTNKQMTKNANRQNILTITNIIVSLSAVMVAYFSYRNSKADSYYNKRKDIIQEITKQLEAIPTKNEKNYNPLVDSIRRSQTIEFLEKLKEEEYSN